MEPPIPNLAGQILGNWSLLRQLGAGSFGAVYEAQHQAIADRRAAVKVLHPHLAADATVKRRFINEANAASRIEHQNIIQIYDGGVSDSGVCYVVMEFIAGHSLEELIAGGRLAPIRAAFLGQQIASALSAAHAAGIVHRDLKPGNLLIAARKGGAEFVKILDFGIAKLQVDQKQTATGVVLGTPLYMPPEQWEGKADMDGRVDIYALGMILYQCLTGEHPFDAKNAMQLMYAHTSKQVADPGEKVALPGRLRELVLRMVRKDPAQRPASMAEVEAELAQVVAELGGAPAATSESALAPVAAGPPRPMAATGDPILSMTAEPSMTGMGTINDSAGAAAAFAAGTQSKTVDAPVAEQAAAVSAPAPARSRRLPALLGGSALLAIGVTVGAVLLLTRGPAGHRTGTLRVTPRAESPGGSKPALEVKRTPATRLVELGPGRLAVGRPGSATAADGPPYTVTVGRFAIEAYEVSVAQLAEYERATHQPGLYTAADVAASGSLPAVQITRAQAQSYCSWRHPGGRLPTEVEWEYAARDGHSDRLFPWAGATSDSALLPSRANVGSPSPRLLPVDSYAAGATPHGLHNLLGNAAEWTLSDSSPYPGSRAVVPRGLAVVRGGSAGTPARGLSATTRQFVAAGHSDPFIGFRCAVSAN